MMTSIGSVNQGSVVAISHIGNSRDNNEDNLLIPAHTIILPEVRDHMRPDNPMVTYRSNYGTRCLCAVSDGMGGQAAGELASLITVDYLSQHADELISAAIFGRQQIEPILYALNQEVCRYAAAENSRTGMGATLSAVIVNESTIVGVHIGDSRIYRCNHEKLEQLSKDHTEGQRLLDLNLMSKDELEQFSYRKALCKHIGMDTNIIVDIFPIDGVIPGTILLLCTDGLTDAVSDEAIKNIVTNRVCSIDEKALHLINRAVKHTSGYGDNTTLVLMEF